MRTTECPELDVLRAFNWGQLTPDAIQEIGDHLRQCSACLALLDALHAATDRTGHQQAVSAEFDSQCCAFLGEPQLRQLSDKAKSLFSSQDWGGATVENVDVPPPERIADYELIGKIGQGGFAHVFLARHVLRGDLVALKITRSDRCFTEKELQAYLNEAKTVATLSHPCIVPVLDSGRWGEAGAYVAMKYVQGNSLDVPIQNGSLDRMQAVSVIAQIAETLHHAHTRGFVHRDVKPANILLDAQGTPHLTDFGLAIHDDEMWGHSGELAGTTAYMAPEQVRCEAHRLDGRTDLWSLGVVFYEMLTGVRPFRGSTSAQVRDEIQFRNPKPPRQIDDAIPKELQRICLKCLAKRMTGRYNTGLDLAEDLRAFLQTSFGGEETVATKRALTLEDSELRVVPKGLRSFDMSDSHFYPALLPGPRNREGLPDSIQFWKTRIEDSPPGQTFAVGLLYGPSGCGKSSLVRAGLLPRLANRIVPVYIEATPHTTETQLLALLRTRFRDVDNALCLADAIKQIREHGAPARKVLIVLDQFEQWLHGRSATERLQLANALRQCDGVRVQCLITVRDDYWMPATRFMQDLDMAIDRGNSNAVDLFTTEHAEEILISFGRAYGTLGEVVTRSQRNFIAQAARALSTDGYVVSVHLALFAHMIKDKPWTPSTLKMVDGLDGIGVAFLEETFGASPSSLRNHRRHEHAARSVLKMLLPEPGCPLRGARHARKDLARASGYNPNSRDFAELLAILDLELRLVTPVSLQGAGESRGLETEGEAEHREAEHRGDTGEEYYQLTHDFVVAPLRKWLQLKDEATRAGRARLRLERRTENWRATQEHRQLPGLKEYLEIRTLTKQSQWTPTQQEMMRHAFWYNSRRALVACIPLLILGILGGLFADMQWRISRLLDAQATAVPAAIDHLRTYRWIAVPFLNRIPKDDSRDMLKRMHAAFALAAFDRPATATIVQHAASIPDAEWPNIFRAIASDPESTVMLKSVYQRAHRADDKDVASRVAAGLMALYLGDARWAHEITELRDDPTERTLFIRQFATRRCCSPEVLAALESSTSPDFRSALYAALGNIPPQSLPADQRDQIARLLARTYLDAREAGVHASAEYALRQWNLPQLDPERRPESPESSPCQWQTNSVGMTMIQVAVDQGDAHMSSMLRPARPFLLSDREVTRKVFALYCQEVGPEESYGWSPDEAVSPSERHPANSTSWEDAVRLANWLSRRENLPEYYRYESGMWRIVDPAGTGYRLPTASEWEYACRAGATTDYVSGTDSQYLADYAVFLAPSAAPCGSRLPNGWGFFDMPGNVWEWCQGERERVRDVDVTGEEAVSDGVTGEIWPADQLVPDLPVICGGACDKYATELRSSNRLPLAADARLNRVGFRVARFCD